MCGWVATKTLRYAAYSLTPADLIATYAGRTAGSSRAASTAASSIRSTPIRRPGRRLGLVNQTGAISGETVAYQYDTPGKAHPRRDHRKSD